MDSPHPAPPSILAIPPVAMARTVSSPPQQQLSSLIESKLTGWLRMVQKEQRVNGDKRIQNTCHKDFELLSSEVHDLCHKFEEFMRAIRPIGSSSGLIFTSSKLKEDIIDVLKAFGSNSAEIWREFSLGVGSNELPVSLQGSSTRDAAMLRLPQAMDDLSEQLKALLSGLCDIPEFSDQRLTDALLGFHEWLQYRAECIGSQQGSRLVRPSTTRQYVGQVMKEMTQYVSRVEAALSDFVKEGVGAIRDTQEKSQTRLQNMSTVATFLSAVTATALQYSMSQDRLRTIVMGLWIGSLILSIASAINSQLAVHWRAAMYRSPRSALPTWTSFLFDHVPLGCLVIAVLAFSAGLVVWTIAADLDISVKISAAAITCATLSVIFTIIIWECIEWCRGQHAKPTPVNIKAIVSTQEPRHHRRAGGSALEEGRLASAGASKTATEGLHQVFQQLLAFRPTTEGFSSLPSKFSLSHGRPNQQPSDVDHGPRDDAATLDPSDAGDDDRIQAEEILQVLHSAKSAHPPLQIRGISTARLKFQKVVRNLRDDENIRAFVSAQPLDMHLRRDKLQELAPIHRLPIFHPSGHDIDFSPDGKRLAVSQLNGAVAIWAVDKFGEEAEVTLPLAAGRFAWSPDSSRIVIIPKRGLSIWETDKLEGFSLKTDPVSVVAWLQSSPNFIAVINDKLQIYDTQLRAGTTHAPIRDLPLRVHDVASIPPPAGPNAKEVILVLGTLRDDATRGDSAWIPTKTEVKRPKSACEERWLMAIELGAGMQQRSIAAAPILADARHISVSSNGQFALISYGDNNVPELWRLRNQSAAGRTQLVFRGRFFTSEPCQSPDGRAGATGQGISGKARFCGESDKWVMATDGGSNIYIWDRVTRHLLHTLKGSQIETKFKHYSSISTVAGTVRNDSKALMVVSTCVGGGVIVWEEPLDGSTRDGWSAEHS